MRFSVRLEGMHYVAGVRQKSGLCLLRDQVARHMTPMPCCLCADAVVLAGTAVTAYYLSKFAPVVIEEVQHFTASQ